MSASFLRILFCVMKITQYGSSGGLLRQFFRMIGSHTEANIDWVYFRRWCWWDYLHL